MKDRFQLPKTFYAQIKQVFLSYFAILGSGRSAGSFSSNNYLLLPSLLFRAHTIGSPSFYEPVFISNTASTAYFKTPINYHYHSNSVMAFFAAQIAKHLHLQKLYLSNCCYPFFSKAISLTFQFQLLSVPGPVIYKHFSLILSSDNTRRVPQSKEFSTNRLW